MIEFDIAPKIQMAEPIRLEDLQVAPEISPLTLQARHILETSPYLRISPASTVPELKPLPNLSEDVVSLLQSLHNTLKLPTIEYFDEFGDNLADTIRHPKTLRDAIWETERKILAPYADQPDLLDELNQLLGQNRLSKRVPTKITGIIKLLLLTFAQQKPGLTEIAAHLTDTVVNSGTPYADLFRTEKETQVSTCMKAAEKVLEMFTSPEPSPSPQASYHEAEVLSGRT